MDWSKRVHAKEWLLLCFLGAGCGRGGCCDPFGEPDESEPVGCGYGDPCDELTGEGCDEEVEPEPEPEPLPDPSQFGCEQYGAATLDRATEVLATVHAAVQGIRSAGNWRERLAWEAMARTRQALITPPRDGDADPGSDTDTGATDPGTTDPGSDTDPGETDPGTADPGLDTDTGTTDSGSGTDGGDTDGDPEPPQAPPEWTFDAGNYALTDGGLTIEARWRTTEPTDFGIPSEPLQADLRQPATYFVDHAFVVTEDGMPPLLPRAGEITFSEPTAYAVLLGLPEPLPNPYAIMRAEFLDLSGVFDDAAFAPTKLIEDETQISVSALGEDAAWISLEAAPDEPSTLWQLLVGTLSRWTVSSLEGGSPSRGQTVAFKDARIFYQGVGGDQLPYPNEPNYAVSGQFYGWFEVAVDGGDVNYDARLEYVIGAERPAVSIECR